MARHTSKPSMPGSMMSIRTTSAGWRWKALSASSPVSASSTVQPSSSRANFTAVRMRSSSSTDKIRVATAMIVPHRARSCRSSPGRRPAARQRDRRARGSLGGSVGVVGVGGEQRFAARAAAGAVVQALGQLGAQTPAGHQGAGPVVGERFEPAQVDVEPAGPGGHGGAGGLDERFARGLVEMAFDGDDDGRTLGRDVDRRPDGVESVAPGGGGARWRPGGGGGPWATNMPRDRDGAWPKGVAIR